MATGPQEEPIFPGWIKALIPLAIIGVAAALVIPNIDWDEVKKSFEEQTDTAGETVDITTGITTDSSDEDNGPIPTYTSAGLAESIAAVRGELGPGGLRLTRIQLNGTFADFHVLRGEQVEGIRYYTGDDSISSLEVNVIGGGPLSAIAFSIGAFSADAPDRILEALRGRTGNPETGFNSLDIRRDPVSNALRWELIASAPGEPGEIFYASPDGIQISRNSEETFEGPVQPGGPPAEVTSPIEPTPSPGGTSFGELEALGDCVSAAGGDVDEIQRCFDEFSAG